ncbi:hypothetical protein [Pseudonocardia sp.]|uniref:hypothetical protein n=1 Tax=Pseudonocardia sp. TaxID=60912 RepID=UPI003D0B92CC
MGDAIDPDLAVVEGAFEAFAEAVVATVLGVVPGAEAAVVADAAAGGAAEPTETAEAAGATEGGSVIAGEGADALYTLPDGSISFSGYGMDGTSYSFGVD